MYTDDELLYQIHSHADQTCDSLENMMNLSDDPQFQLALNEHLKGQRMIYEQTDRMLSYKNIQGKTISPFHRTINRLNAGLRTMQDRSTSHLAELTMEQINTGLCRLLRLIKHYQGGNEKLTRMAKAQLRLEEESQYRLREFL